MEKLTLADLSEVFVPFETVKTNTGKIVYCNANLECNLSDGEILSNYSYVTVAGDVTARGLDDKKIFFAERYGGDGILTNGGGARCGFDGVFQLKGLGVNKLVGIRPPDAYGNSHANGFLSLNIAIHESVWAEIVQLALPYGAVRTVAIIDLEVEFEETNVPHARALLVRLPAVRPAHFIRAIYFKEKKYSALSEDAKRVSTVMQKLISFLPGKSNGQEPGVLFERLSLGMVELATRYARQFATARSKRIYHANVSASNITIDGAWMDLAGSAVFSDRLWWSGFNVNNFKEERAPAINSVREMCFYLSKYGVVSLEESSNIFEKSISAFDIEFEKTLSLCNALQVGFPLFIIRHINDHPSFLEFSQNLRRVLAKDKYAVVPISAGSWIGYEHWISRFYMQLLNGKLNDEILDLSWICEDRSLLSQIVTSYGSLFDLVVSEASIRGVRRKNLAACIAINLTRLNRCSSVLIELQDEISDTIRSSRGSEDISRYRQIIERSILAGSQAFKYDEGFILSFWEDESVVVQFDALTGLFVVEDKRYNTKSVGSLAEIKDKAVSMEAMFCFYRNIRGVFYE